MKNLSKNLTKIMKTRGVEVIKPLVFGQNRYPN